MENEAFRTIGYTIGAMTINGARGFNQSIADRMDLTLECIRRYYVGQRSPLTETLARYPDFFGLFETFSGYVDFFLLDDLVDERSGDSAAGAAHSWPEWVSTGVRSKRESPWGKGGQRNIPRSAL